MAIPMYWCFRSFGLRPQDDKRSPQDNKGYVILSKAKNLNAACHSERSEESKQKDPVSLY